MFEKVPDFICCQDIFFNATTIAPLLKTADVLQIPSLLAQGRQELGTLLTADPDLEYEEGPESRLLEAVSVYNSALALQVSHGSDDVMATVVQQSCSVLAKEFDDVPTEGSAMLPPIALCTMCQAYLWGYPVDKVQCDGAGQLFSVIKHKDRTSYKTLALRCDHLSFMPPNTICFDFLGANCTHYKSSITIEQVLYDNMRTFVSKREQCLLSPVFDKLSPRLLEAYFLVI